MCNSTAANPWDVRRVRFRRTRAYRPPKSTHRSMWCPSRIVLTQAGRSFVSHSFQAVEASASVVGTASVAAAPHFRPLILEERGALVSRKAEAMLANLSGTFAERELTALASHLDLAPKLAAADALPNVPQAKLFTLLVASPPSPLSPAASLSHTN